MYYRLKWHGKIGVWIWFTGMINIIIGAIFWHGKLVGLRVILIIAVICVLAVVAIFFRKVAVIRKGDQYAEVARSAEVVEMLEDVDVEDLETRHQSSNKYRDNEDQDHSLQQQSSFLAY